MNKAKMKRLWELDALRGVAIILMVLYHLVYNLDSFFGLPINSGSGFWYYEGRLSAVLFILLAGMATSLIAKKYKGVLFWKKQLGRSLKLFFFGLIITGVTWLIYPEKTIWFGILHFMAVAILISSILVKKFWLNLFLSAILFATNDHLARLDADHYFGLIFGYKPAEFESFDYYPLFPYLAWMLMGMIAANLIYKKQESIFHFKPTSSLRALAWAGKNSLWIYLLHQPILLGILWLIL